MSEPLFLKSQMHDKIWGGTKLREAFGYDIPTETTGEYWAISAHPNGVSVIKNGIYEGEGLDQLYREHKELFGHPKSEVFPLLIKILDSYKGNYTSAQADAIALLSSDCGIAVN
ncbi:MAG: hypothetical protein KIG60_06565, partial [Caryophanon sp.]|nr:hypothetical protein [Caryophanon sp.]